MPCLVTLTTDFGLTDPYVGQVKGVILGLCPTAQIVDLTHFIPPQAVSRAALVVAASAEHFPDGAIHLAVVDPGVGTARRALVVQANGHLFVAPDNGLLTVVLRRNPEAKVRAVTNEALPRTKISPTFHGRDVFAPVVGHLANGLPPAQVGPRIDDPVTLDLAEAVLSGGRIRGQVIYADRFGNLVTNVPVDLLYKRPGKGTPKIHLAGRVLTGLHLTYAEKEPGQPLALIGSLDFLEIAVNQGRADKHFGVAEGEPVEVEL